jgi:hypothetical protein
MGSRAIIASVGTDTRALRGRSARRGAMLVLVALFLTIALAAGGLAIDLCRVLAARSALQSQLEAAAIAAALELDSTFEGIHHARQAALAGGGVPNFRAAGVRTEFSAEKSAWDQNPANAREVRRVRVSGTTAVPLTVLRAFVRAGVSSVWASASAEQRRRTSFEEGLFPYAVLGPGDTGPHYGLQTGGLHTLRWASKAAMAAGQVCEADTSAETVAMAALEETAGLLESGRRDDMRNAMVWGWQSRVRKIGELVDYAADSGRDTRAVELAALLERIAQDTDAVSRDYRIYAGAGVGNGRRIVAAPIRSGGTGGRMVEVGAFFLLTADRYLSGHDQPFCAEYLGPYVEGGRRRGVGESGYFQAVLLR